MKILSISKILPVPKIIKQNDFVLKFYSVYTKLYPEDHILIFRPSAYSNKVLDLFNKKNVRFYDLIKNPIFKLGNFTVHILPHFSAFKWPNFHVLVAYSIYFLNRQKIKRILTEESIDFVHAQLLIPDGLLAYFLFIKFRIPYIITTHNELHYFNKFCSKKIAKKILSKAKLITTINHKNFCYFKHERIGNPILIPLGFDYNFLSQRTVEKFLSSTVKILSVGELIKLKNIDKVLRAVGHLIKKYNISYTIIGEGSEEKKLKQLAKELDIMEFVDFIGHITHEKLPELMIQYDIFILPSYPETFGRVFFEAMAVGLPIICAKNSGIYGYFKEDIEGFSVNHQDINQIINILEQLIVNPNKRIMVGNNGKALVKNYTWENICEIFYKIYHN